METLKACYEEAKELLSGNRELMDKLAAHLIEKETISGKEFMKIYRQEKGIPEPEEEDKEKKDAGINVKAEEAENLADAEKKDFDTVTEDKDDFFEKKEDTFFQQAKEAEEPKQLGEEQPAAEQKPMAKEAGAGAACA
jgi:cell division protease FtsH